MQQIQKKKQIQITKEAISQELGRRELLHFVTYMSDNVITPFHATYYNILDLFFKGLIKNLMITVPPQHGKSDGSTRYGPSFGFGLNPNKKIAICSYADSFAQKFNRDIQRIIDSDKYYTLFPKTTLNRSNVVTITDKYVRNSHEFEIVNKKGSLKAVGRGGGLTGNPVDIAIMDDLYKDRKEGNSPHIRNAVIEWYTSVLIKRLHNNSQQLIVFTRWHENDLIGYLEDKGLVIEAKTWKDLLNAGNNFLKVNFEAIKESDPTELDPREKNVPLFPQRHSLEKLEDERKLNPLEFDCMNQGNPSSAEGLLYSEFMIYEKLPVEPVFVKSQTDTADLGDCYLCSITYFEYMDLKYVLDVYYTQDKQEITEEEQARKSNEFNVNNAVIESNNGGRGYARNVKRITREKYKNLRTSFRTPTTRANKESRILSNSTTVTNTIVMPANWMHRWPVFYKHVVKFRADFSSKYKDGPDVLTAIAEKDKKALPFG